MGDGLRLLAFTHTSPSQILTGAETEMEWLFTVQKVQTKAEPLERL